MLTAIGKEIQLQKAYLTTTSKLDTIYFGGGTPSLLSSADIGYIFNIIRQHFEVADNAEITLEANPDDLSMAKLTELKDSPINRLSIGIQSFMEEDLRFMNRAHNAEEALFCLKAAKDFGFENMTIDLIYGTPTLTDRQWQTNLQTIFDLDIPHISCYALTVEPKTALDHFVKKGKVPPVNEAQAARQFETMLEMMEQYGYEHYEISNFAKPGHYSRHNSSYWLGYHYLGVGPSAHSFNGHSRQWNVANNAQYIKALEGGEVPFEIEKLSPKDQFNEYLMTALRTKWGCDVLKVKTWGSEVEALFLKNCQPFLAEGLIRKDKNKYYLTNKGKFLADGIISDLFLI